MFDVGSALVKPYMRNILREIGVALIDVENRIALSGHTDATPYGSGERGYSNWELSSDRANASRRELVAGGLSDAKLVRVEGLASSRLLEPEAPTAPVNRRISILVLTREAEQRLQPTAAPTSLTLPEGEPPPGQTPGTTSSHGPEPAAIPGLQKSAELTKTHAQAGG
jgi:chemotaxis protein MotB